MPDHPLSCLLYTSPLLENYDDPYSSYTGKYGDKEYTVSISQYGGEDDNTDAGVYISSVSYTHLIYDVDIVKEGDYVHMRFHGNGFLQNMVRILTGTLVDVGYGNMSAEHIPEIIAGMDRQLAGPTAPPHGLCLMKVEYD